MTDIRKGMCPGCPWDYGSELTEQAYNWGCLPSTSEATQWSKAEGKAWACHSEPNKMCCGYAAENKGDHGKPLFTNGTHGVRRMIEQRSPAWHQQRKGRVTGSVAGAVLGVSPNMTRDQALRMLVRDAVGAEKENAEFVENTILAHGRHYEEGALWEYEMETGNTVQECSFFPLGEWSGASPDGLISDDGILEIKTPWGKRKQENVVFKTLDEQPHYYAQMQIEMLATGRTWGHLWQWTPHGNRLDKVVLDQAWCDENVPRLRQFWAELQDAIADPDEHLQPLRKIIDTPDAAKMVAEWDDLTEAEERAKERKKDLLSEMVILAGGGNALIGGRKLTSVSKAGSVSYSKVVKEKLPDLDLAPWTGKESQHWRLS